MAFHVEVLEERQVAALEAMAPALTARGFYLAGGTAVALQLGHRRSVDLDWFSPDALSDPLALAADLKAEGVSLEPTAVAPNTLHGLLAGVKVSLLTYRYPLLRPLVTWPEIGCCLASLEDLACIKLAAVAQRGARKDFLDLAALGRQGRGLAEMIAWFKQKYSLQDVGHILIGLCYFDDADREPMPMCLDGADWEATKAMMKDWVKTYFAEAARADAT